MDARTGLPVVGMVGGGQLARMTHQAAIPLGQSLRVLATDPADAAALVAADVEIGHHTDLAALRRFAASCDVVTFDHEHVPQQHLRALAAEGVTVLPGADALQHAQDKAVMRRRLAELGLPVPDFVVVDGDPAAAVADFRAAHGGRAVLKSASGGYDGRGVWIVADEPDPGELPTGDGPWVVEELVGMRRELAAVLARSPFGQVASWAVVETVQQDGICTEVIAPAPGLDERTASAATRLAMRIAQELGVVGILAVELFEVDADERFPDGIVVNELAMRPHNSAHWTMDGAVTGQFEQHLRAVLDYPLGATALRAPVTVMGNVLGGAADSPGAAIGIDERIHHLAARFPQVKVHWYGKGVRPGRKVGHVNVCGDDASPEGVAELRRVATLAARWLGDGVWADGWSAHDGAASAAAAERSAT